MRVMISRGVIMQDILCRQGSTV